MRAGVQPPCRETIEPVADVIADFGNIMRSTDHVEFYWMPGGRRCQVKRNTRTDAAGRAASEIGLRPRQVDRREPRVRHGLPRRATFPIARPEGGQARHLRGRRTRADRPQRSDLLQPAPRPLPRDGVRHPLRRRAGCDRTDQRPRVDAAVPAAVPDRGPRRRPPTTFRCRPPTAETSGWIAIHQYVGAPYEAYFQGVEQIMNDYAGRPHWGKLHYQSSHTLAPRYPEWHDVPRLARQARPRGHVPQPVSRPGARRAVAAATLGGSPSGEFDERMAHPDRVVHAKPRRRRTRTRSLCDSVSRNSGPATGRQSASSARSAPCHAPPRSST